MGDPPSLNYLQHDIDHDTTTVWLPKQDLNSDNTNRHGRGNLIGTITKQRTDWEREFVFLGIGSAIQSGHPWNSYANNTKQAQQTT